MDPFPRQKAGLFRPRVPRRIPRQIPDHVFNDLFTRLPSNRDRALVGFWISTGARASELISVTCSGGRSRAAAHYRDPQGIAGHSAAAGIAGRVRVAAPLPAGDARAGAVRAG